MGCDAICDLPDPLLTQILVHLPTKESAKTSVLSTRWRNLWLSVPGLDLDTHQFRGEEIFDRFIDRFMEFHPVSRLQNFKIVGYCYFDRLMEFINTVVNSGFQRLDVSMYPCFRCYSMRQSIYKNKTMVSLRLVNVELKNPVFAVSLPCLKIMKLVQVFYGKDGSLVLEKLISGCPVLEDLELIRPFDILNERDVLLFLRVSSQTLKRCYLGFVMNRSDTDFSVEIDAPRLEYLRLSSIQPNRIVVKNMNSLFMIDIFTNFNFKCDISSPLQPEDLRKLDIFCDFLTRISGVRHMIISHSTLKLLYSYSKLGPNPQFHNLYHLEAKFYSSSLQLLLAFLESCPNLKSLSLLDICYSKEPRQIDFTNVPRCLVSTLEYVEIKKQMRKYDTEIFKLVNYFLENSAVLKKLTLSFKDSCKPKEEAKRYKKLLTITKLSPTCQVFID